MLIYNKIEIHMFENLSSKDIYFVDNNYFL